MKIQIKHYLKGFYLIECVIAQLIMSFIVCTVLFISTKLYEDSIDFHYTVLTHVINVSTKQANMMGVFYDANSYAQTVLPHAVVNIKKSTVTTCWQVKTKQCETL